MLNSEFGMVGTDWGGEARSRVGIGARFREWDQQANGIHYSRDEVKILLKTKDNDKLTVTDGRVALN
jgi:hypothetical protein